MKRHVKYAKHFVYYLIAVVIGRIVLFLPRKFALRLGILLGDLWFLFSRKEKARAIENLSIAFGKEKKRDNLRICRLCFRNLGKGLIEFLQFPRLNKENFSRLVTMEGKQNADDALRMGKGGINLSAHFGNWELLGASLPLAGYPSNTIVRPVKIQRLDNLVNRYREGTGLKCIERGASVKGALQCLKRNEFLGILADVDTKVDGVFVDFFGHPAFTPKGPVSIALRTGAALIPTFIIRQKDDTHKIIMEKPLKLIITGDTQEDIKVNTAAFTRIIESYIREYPEQWIWFHKRWRN